MSQSFLNDMLSDTQFLKLTDNMYYKWVDQQSFNIIHDPELDNKLGHYIEFRVDDTLILIAYCIDKTDFTQVLNTFNV